MSQQISPSWVEVGNAVGILTGTKTEGLEHNFIHQQRFYPEIMLLMELIVS